MNIDSLLDELGRRMSLGALKLDDDGLCRVVFDERMTVDIELDRVSGFACLHGSVVSRDAVRDSGALEELLAANLLGVNGHDNYLSLDAERREIVLFSRLPPADGLDYEDFVIRLEHFVNDLEFWMDRFDSAEVGAEHVATEPRDEERSPFGGPGGVRV